MASFVGTNKEFRRYIGPMLRNLVQQITKRHKAEVSSCEHCGISENLESAHVHGRDRNEIIDLILSEYTHNRLVTVDLEVFESKFKEEHLPFEKSILILCRSCHRKYDAKAPQLVTSEQAASQFQQHSQRPLNNFELLPITLEPADVNMFKENLLKSKQAEIQTTYNDGRIERRTWNASRFSKSSNVFGNLRSRPEFRSGTWQANGIVKVHVEVTKDA